MTKPRPQHRPQSSYLETDDPALEPTWKQRARQEVRKGGLCPECLGVRWVKPGDFPIGHPRFGALERCPSCQKGQLSTYLRSVSGLTGWQAQASFAGYLRLDSRVQQYDAAQALVDRGSGWLTLWGGYGVGKTYLLAAIVNTYLVADRPAVYITAGKLLDHLRDAYRPEGLGYSAAFSQWANCQVLAIDEADVFHETNWAMDKYRQLLEHRYNLACAEDSITVFATNLQPAADEWPGRLGWLASRMLHFEVVEALGGDIRPMLAEESRDWVQEKFG